MREAVKGILAKYSPKTRLIDLCSFEYQFGDWIGSVLLTALHALERGRVCILPTGATGPAIRSLWEFSKLDQLIPLVQNVDEAFERLRAAILQVNDSAWKPALIPPFRPNK